MNISLLPSLRTAAPRRDLVAALTLAAIAIPEQLATAQLAGVPAAQGLVVFAVASLVMLLVSRDGTLSVGADSTIAPMIAAVLAASAAVPGDAALLAAMVGAVLLAVYLLRLEWIAELLSRPVASGMLAGIAVHILAGRLPTALGLEVSAQGPVNTLLAVWQHAADANLAPLAMTAAVAAVSLAGARINPRFPAPLFALAGAIAVARLIDPGGTDIPRISGFAEGIGLALPDWDPARLIVLLPTTASIAFLCLSQTTVVLRTVTEDSDAARRNAFGAIGLANIATAAIGGFGVNSSPPRTQLLRDSGARSQLAGVTAALAGLALLWAGADLISQLPAAAMAGVLVYIAVHLFSTAALGDVLRRSRNEGLIALATALLVILLPLYIGLPIAILLSLIYASVPLFQSDVVVLRNVPGTTVWWHEPQAGPQAPQIPGLLVLGVTSPMSFANAAGIAARIRNRIAAAPEPPRLVVLECAGLLAIDLTSADILTGLITDLRGQGIRVAMARVESEHAQEKLAHTGVLDCLGLENLFQSVDEALDALGQP